MQVRGKLVVGRHCLPVLIILHIMVSSDQENQRIFRELYCYHGNQEKMREFNGNVEYIRDFCKSYSFESLVRLKN